MMTRGKKPGADRVYVTIAYGAMIWVVAFAITTLLAVLS
jgi:hypothetical protein